MKIAVLISALYKYYYCYYYYHYYHYYYYYYNCSVNISLTLPNFPFLLFFFFFFLKHGMGISHTFLRFFFTKSNQAIKLTLVCNKTPA